MVIVGCTFQVFYEKATAEAMAHRVAEAFRRGSARGFDLVVTCEVPPWFTITIDLLISRIQVALVADVGRPNRLAAKHDVKPAILCPV